MDTARIAALLEPFLDRPLPIAALEQISIYIDLLVRWNARVNLTAVRSPDQIAARHFGESLFLARYLFPRPGSEPLQSAAQSQAADRDGGTAGSSPALRVLDIGSGAGFPGVPLKLWVPQIHLTLIESNHKKAAFLREVIRSITLTNVDVIAERAEVLLSAAKLTTADVVTLRAVERFEAILPTAVRFLAPAGRLALLIGSSQIESLPRLAPTVKWSSHIPIPLSSATVISIGSID
jgi:16S rRNA (guanine527-N7)-methyltransferase